MTPRLFALLLGLAALPAVASPADDLAASVEMATGQELGEEALVAARADLAAADPARAEAFVPILAAMGRLAAGAEHPATREVMRDLHRQLAENLVADPEASPTVAILEARNPLLGEVVLGAGIAQSDVAAAAYLGALLAALPDDPTAAPLDEAAVRAEAARIRAEFDAALPVDKQVIARLDAWLAGLLAAWPDLSPEERRAAAAFASETAVPSPDLVRKVTGAGTGDLVAWVGSLDLALTPEERAAEPDLVAFLDEWQMTGGATEMLQGRLMAGQVAAAGTGTLLTQMRLNQELLWSDLSGRSVAGDLLGLE